MKAIKLAEVGKPAIKEVPLPRLRDDYILVKVNTVALNPADWKYISQPGLCEFSVGCTLGADYAGTVVEVGAKVTKAWRPGDRIAGFTHGANAVEQEDGCFAEYAVVKGDAGQLNLTSADHVSDEEACTFGVGLATASQALYQCLELPLPGKGAKMTSGTMLVYGGSSATGSLVIQLAKLAGLRVVTTCSPHNFEFVKSAGAVEAFDYKDPECGRKIHQHTQDQVTHAVDCVAEGNSSQICCEAVSSKGGKVWYTMPLSKHDRTDVEIKTSLAYTFTGEPFTFVNKAEVPASQEDFELAKTFSDVASQLIANGQLKNHPPQVEKDGLAGVLDGMQQLSEGKVSGKKLVYRISETPDLVVK